MCCPQKRSTSAYAFLSTCAVFMVLAESSVTGEVASGFLGSLKEDFLSKYGQKAAKMGANSLDKQYG